MTGQEMLRDGQADGEMAERRTLGEAVEDQRAARVCGITMDTRRVVTGGLRNWWI